MQTSTYAIARATRAMKEQSLYTVISPENDIKFTTEIKTGKAARIPVQIVTHRSEHKGTSKDNIK